MKFFCVIIFFVMSVMLTLTMVQYAAMRCSGKPANSGNEICTHFACALSWGLFMFALLDIIDKWVS